MAIFFFPPSSSTMVTSEVKSLDKRMASLKKDNKLSQDLSDSLDAVKSKLIDNWVFNWFQPEEVQLENIEILEKHLTLVEKYTNLPRGQDNQTNQKLERSFSEALGYFSPLSSKVALTDESRGKILQSKRVTETKNMVAGAVVSGFAASVFLGSWLSALTSLSVVVVSQYALECLESKTGLQNRIPSNLLPFINASLSIAAGLFVLSALEGSFLIATTYMLTFLIVYLISCKVFDIGLDLAINKVLFLTTHQRRDCIQDVITTLRACTTDEGAATNESSLF